MLSHEEIRAIYRQTTIVRRPTYGIISGYHELPYVCLGQAFDCEHATTQVRGKVHVSPRFVLRPPRYEPSYDDVFGEDNVDGALTGRVFGFLGFRGRPVECSSEHLEVKRIEKALDETLSVVLDDLARYEDIRTGVIVTPDSRYYPVSIERFIAGILDDEFST